MRRLKVLFVRSPPVDPVSHRNDSVGAGGDVVVEGPGHDGAGSHLVVVRVHHHARPRELPRAGPGKGEAAGGDKAPLSAGLLSAASSQDAHEALVPDDDGQVGVLVLVHEIRLLAVEQAPVGGLRAHRVLAEGPGGALQLQLGVVAAAEGVLGAVARGAAVAVAVVSDRGDARAVARVGGHAVLPGRQGGARAARHGGAGVATGRVKTYAKGELPSRLIGTLSGSQYPDGTFKLTSVSSALNM